MASSVMECTRVSPGACWDSSDEQGGKSTGHMAGGVCRFKPDATQTVLQASDRRGGKADGVLPKHTEEPVGRSPAHLPIPGLTNPACVRHISQ